MTIGSGPNTPPFPSIPILSTTPPLLHTPYLVGPGVLRLPDDPLLPDITATQAGDPIIFASIGRLQRGSGGDPDPTLPSGSPSGRSDDQQQLLHGGLLYHQGRLLVPPTSCALILKILQQCHDSPLAGHYGVARTQALVSQHYKWHGLVAPVESYVRSCVLGR